MDITEVSIVHHIAIVLLVLWILESIGWSLSLLYFAALFYLFAVQSRVRVLKIVPTTLRKVCIRPTRLAVRVAPGSLPTTLRKACIDSLPARPNVKDGILGYAAPQQFHHHTGGSTTSATNRFLQALEYSLSLIHGLYVSINTLHCSDCNV
ncbi:hypothetical protein IEQ34_021480 [Dendrobium chrysotoxum]|uniref:Uncharacterized protein n=1 Tax=Dendrobium chrysotoxum TaxID=161865 RepID=A0AAV7G529_DENCH|nr:hypothetical protein IEQ34_021480 [Dendrobium chrysotoxum]